MPTLQPDVVAMMDGSLVLGESKAGDSYLTNAKLNDFSTSARLIEEAIRPVPLTVVHSWTQSFSPTLRQKAATKMHRVNLRFVELPERLWYAAGPSTNQSHTSCSP